MKQVIVCAIVGLIALPVLGVETFRDVHRFGREGILWDVEQQRWKDNPSVRWTHHLDGLGDCAQVSSATLTIEGRGIENVWWDMDKDGGYEQMDWVDVYFNNQLLGTLQGNSTTFNLDTDLIEEAMNFGATITFQNDLWGKGQHLIDFDWVDSVFLKKSILRVVADCHPVAVPVPGAFLLAGFGTILVGTLRRRKAI